MCFLNTTKNLSGLRAAAYARYSTANQNELSIAAQLNEIRAFCERMGITLIDRPYIDEAQTGTNTDRAGFQALCRDAQLRQFNAVVIYDVTRGSRNVGDWFQFRGQMEALGIRVISATDKLGDPDDPNAFLTELLTVGIGQHQVLQSRQKSILGKRTKAERGQFCGGVPPLGYDVVNGQYVINEHEAAGVRRAFEMYAGGHSYSQIIAELNRMGVRGKRGVPLQNNTLYFILHNERYTGKFTWFTRENRRLGKWVGRDGKEPIILEGIIPPLVEPGTWEMVQRRLSENKRLGYGLKHSEREYLLSGLIRCGCCGSAMFGSTSTAKGRKYKTYQCLAKKRDKSCKLKNIRAEGLEDAVAKYLRETVIAPRMIETMADLCLELFEKPANVEPLRAELASLKNKNQNFMRAIENGLEISPAFIERVNAINERIAAIENELVETHSKYTAPSRDELVKVLRAGILEGSEAGQTDRELVIRYVDSVTVFDDHVEVGIFPQYLRSAFPGVDKKSSQPSEEGCELRGSSGRARTYNPSVNSRMLCH